MQLYLLVKYGYLLNQFGSILQTSNFCRASRTYVQITLILLQILQLEFITTLIITPINCMGYDAVLQ